MHRTPQPARIRVLCLPDSCTGMCYSRCSLAGIELKAISMRKNAIIGLLGLVVIILVAAFMMRGPSQPSSGLPASNTPPAVAPPGTSR
jgi:hypothetical protein